MLRVLHLYILILDIGQSILIVDCSVNFTYIFWSMNKTIIESGFGRVSTLGSNDPTILEGVESQCDIYESGFGEVLTLVSNDSTISEEVPIEYENKVAIHDATENYYEGGICACRSCNNTKFSSLCA